VATLARLIAIMAMGQAAYAAHVLKTMAPTEPPINIAELRAEAKIKLTVEEPAKKPRGGYPRWQRDGLIFEAISWLVARQMHPRGLLKMPHVSSTTQGLDGLMIEMNAGKTGVSRTTIFEDKCVENPQHTFLYTVLPEFMRRHENKRSAELISAAVALIQTTGIDEVTATEFAAAVTDQSLRSYRAAFAVDVDTDEERKKIFADYNKITNLTSDRRVGATLVVPPKMRDRFDALAKEAIAYLDGMDSI
jgi:hypothetical protein